MEKYIQMLKLGSEIFKVNEIHTWKYLCNRSLYIKFRRNLPTGPKYT